MDQEPTSPVLETLQAKPFRCCGQEFVITKFDSVGEIPADVIIRHDCPKITVAQEHRSIKRFFKRKWNLDQ